MPTKGIVGHLKANRMRVFLLCLKKPSYSTIFLNVDSRQEILLNRSLASSLTLYNATLSLIVEESQLLGFASLFTVHTGLNAKSPCA